MTINGNFWTTHAEWMAQVGPRHLVLGCGFTPAKRNALKAKTDSSLATSAGTFVAAPKHWVFSVYFYHTEEWTERNQQILEATSREIRRCPGLWILAGDFNMERRFPGFTVVVVTCFVQILNDFHDFVSECVSFQRKINNPFCGGHVFPRKNHKFHWT